MHRNWSTAPTTKVAPPALRQSRVPAWTQALALPGNNAVIMVAAVNAGTIERNFMTGLPCGLVSWAGMGARGPCQRHRQVAKGSWRRQEIAGRREDHRTHRKSMPLTPAAMLRPV